MGRLLKFRNKDTKWRLWTTISDGWLTDWLTEEEMKAVLADDYKRDYKLKVIEAYWTFPHKYYDKDTHKMFNNHKAMIEFGEWHLEALKSKDYEAEVDKKYLELTNPKKAK